MSFTITDPLLRKLCTVNSFSFPQSGIVFFGLRGCLPVDTDNDDLAKSHQLSVIGFDHIHPRCTIGQWLPDKGTFAVFAGSTVPYLREIERSKDKGGQGANMLMTGFYTDYRKGRHMSSRPTGHEAFRQTNVHPIRRTADDLDYDEDDRVEHVNPSDNIHAAWCTGVDGDYFASAGCQVIVGYPRCEKRGDRDHTGAWKVFHDNAYDRDSQDRFAYILLSGFDAQKITSTTRGLKPRLRFGSSGPLVTTVQKALKEHNFYEGNLDEDFGTRTNRAVMEFQEHEFGSGSDDGVVGPMTAQALGIAWSPID